MKLGARGASRSMGALRSAGRAALLAGLAVMMVPSAQAQAYPTKAIKVIVPFAPGGGSDLVARIVAPKLQALLGQPIVIDNKGGAGGMLGMELTARSVPDGYTVLIMSDSFPALAATQKPAFDPMKSLLPVAQICIAPFALMVHPSVPAKTAAEFVQYVKRNPDQYSYGSSGSGGLTHLITEAFNEKAGSLKMVHVPYKSTGAATADLLSGQIQVYLGSVPPLMQQVNVGRLKLLAVTNRERWPLMPNVPTLGETVPGFSADPWFGLFVPRGTPPAIAQTLERAMAKVREDEDIKRALIAQNMLPRGGTSADFASVVTADFSRWSKLVKDIGFKPSE